MTETERRLSAKGIAFFGALTVILGLLHLAYDLLGGGNGPIPGGVGGNALFAIVLTTVYVFGLGWSWKERKVGYGLALVLSLFPFFLVAFLSHSFGIMGSEVVTDAAAGFASESVALLFVFATLAVGLTSLTTLLLSAYALATPR